jgi:hypothetical protein
MVIAILVLSPIDSILKKSNKLFISFTILVLSFNAYQIADYFQSIKEEGWVNVIEVILRNEQGKAIVVLEDYMEESSMDYYVRKMNVKNKIQLHYLKDLSDMKLLAKDQDHIWFIYSKEMALKGFNVDHYFTEENLGNSNQYLQLVKMKSQSQHVYK